MFKIGDIIKFKIISSVDVRSIQSYQVIDDDIGYFIVKGMKNQVEYKISESYLSNIYFEFDIVLMRKQKLEKICLK
jgi:hypothetical protein